MSVRRVTNSAQPLRSPPKASIVMAAARFATLSRYCPSYQAFTARAVDRWVPLIRLKPSFGPNSSGATPMRSSASLAGICSMRSPTGIVQRPFAQQRQHGVRPRSKVARCSHAPLRGNLAQDPRFEDPGDRLQGLHANAAVAATDRVQADQPHGHDDIARQQVANAAAMGTDNVLLQMRRFARAE